jgi:uncharacterized protein DUF1844
MAIWSPAKGRLCYHSKPGANIKRLTNQFHQGALARGLRIASRVMSEEQPVFKVVDRRPFNPDGTPRELSEQEKEEAERAANAAAVENAAAKVMSSQPEPAPQAQPKSRPAPASRPERQTAQAHGDPLDDPTSFLSLIMSLASNAAASLGMMPHPVTGDTGVDLKTAKHWIDILGMLEQKTQGNLDEQEAQMLENLLADLRMQYVSFTNAPAPPPSKFSASDITGGK